MENVCRVDVLESTEDLVQKVTDVVVAQLLILQQLVKVGLHQTLHDVSVNKQTLLTITLPLPLPPLLLLHNPPLLLQRIKHRYNNMILELIRMLPTGQDCLLLCGPPP